MKIQKHKYWYQIRDYHPFMKGTIWTTLGLGNFVYPKDSIIGIDTYPSFSRKFIENKKYIFVEMKIK